MASPWGAIVLAAGVAAASTAAFAQPIVSPREVAKPAPKPAAKPAAKPAKPAAKSAKATKPARSTKPTVQARAARPAVAVKATGDNMPRGFAWPATPAMKAAGKACEADLDALNVAWKPSTPEGRISDPVEVTDGMLGGIKYTSKWQSPPYKLDCQLARALAQAGHDLYAAGVREVRWGSVYRWSNVRTQGKTFPFLSRHALGLAIDIVDFVDDNGRVANVQHDYLGGDALLSGVEQVVNASGKFRIMLTPKNDPKSHYDHFHIEANPDYSAP